MRGASRSPRIGSALHVRFTVARRRGATAALRAIRRYSLHKPELRAAAPGGGRGPASADSPARTGCAYESMSLRIPGMQVGMVDAAKRQLLEDRVDEHVGGLAGRGRRRDHGDRDASGQRSRVDVPRARVLARPGAQVVRQIAPKLREGRSPGRSEPRSVRPRSRRRTRAPHARAARSGRRRSRPAREPAPSRRSHPGRAARPRPLRRRRPRRSVPSRTLRTSMSLPVSGDHVSHRVAHFSAAGRRPVATVVCAAGIRADARMRKDRGCLRGLSLLLSVVDLRGFEPLTSSLRTKRATNCATGPRTSASLSRSAGAVHIAGGVTGHASDSSHWPDARRSSSARTCSSMAASST